MSNVKFEDHSEEVKVTLTDAIIAWLHEVGGEVASQATRNCQLKKADVGVDLPGGYKYELNEEELTATVGNPYEAVYWEEFGTGEYALHHDGRKGWWVYVEGQESKGGGKTYRNQEEAEEAAAFLRKTKGLQAYATNGRAPSRTLFNAFNQASKNSQKGLEQQLRRINSK